MKISQFNSRSERESNLSSLSSSFKYNLKKSFTLIELSIVLLILSLLVGSLLVGRQIVDRAKIQRIIFEFDYYEKAFHQFYDTYRVVPGNLDEKACNKYAAIFNKDCDFKRCTYKSGGQTSSLVVAGFASWKLNAGFMSKRAYNVPFLHMKYAGLIDFEFKNEVNSGYKHHCRTDNTEIEPGGLSGAGIGKIISETPMFFPQTSFDPETYVRVLGFDFSKAASPRFIAHIYHVNREELTLKHKQALNNHNALILSKPYKNNNARDRMAQRSALNAKLSSELDAKIDDGRPTTGKLLGVKTMYGLLNPTEEVCYDDHELYLNTTENKNGCHLLRVMEDIK